MHKEVAVAADRHTRPVWRGEFGPKQAGNVETHGAKVHAADGGIRVPRLAVPERPVVVEADVADEGGVLRQTHLDLGRCALRIDRLTVGGKARGDQLVDSIR